MISSLLLAAGFSRTAEKLDPLTQSIDTRVCFRPVNPSVPCLPCALCDEGI